jgi:hypothetical protein
MVVHEEWCNIRTGDVVLLSGWSTPSILIRVGTYSEWTHAAIAVWLNTTEGRRLHLFEAARVRDQHCAIRQDTNVGCRLVDMDQVSCLYSKVAVRPLNVRRDRRLYDLLRAFMREHQGVEVPKELWRLFLVNTGIVNRNASDESGILCSELCSRWLERCELVSAEWVQAHPHHLATPRCLSGDERFPAEVFGGPLRLVRDDRMDNTVRCTLMMLWIASLVGYIFLSVEDERNYHLKIDREDRECAKRRQRASRR